MKLREDTELHLFKVALLVHGRAGIKTQDRASGFYTS